MELKITSMNIVLHADFYHQKQDLLNLLRIFSSKLSFPQSLIKSIKKIKLYTLADYMVGYNESIKESKKLIVKLQELMCWGYMFDSYYSWKISVDSIRICLLKYTSEIINYIVLCVQEPYKSKKMFINNIKINNFTLFFAIEKNSDGYEYIIKDDDDIYLHNSITLEEIEKLFPKCIYKEKAPNGIGFINCYEKSHKLEPIDII